MYVMYCGLKVARLYACAQVAQVAEEDGRRYLCLWATIRECIRIYGAQRRLDASLAPAGRQDVADSVLQVHLPSGSPGSPCNKHRPLCGFNLATVVFWFKHIGKLLLL